MPKFPESALAHALLDGLDGVEIGAGAHNPFGIAGCKNVNWSRESNLCTEEEIRLCGEFAPVDIVADAWALPFEDNSLGYVIACHVAEHLWDTIGALREWYRVIRPGGYVFMIVPHRDRCQPDDTMPITTIEELERRHSGEIPVPADYGPGGYYAHRSYWRLPDFVALVEHLGMTVCRTLEVCDKVPNGFTVVVQKQR
jgi:SAM-dependent methyltransferase